jgi:malonyl CoA-acyl carrier protein transacylase
MHLLVILPSEAAHLAPRVVAAGGTPVVDLTCATEVPAVPDGAWVRVRPGQKAPGTGPVLLTGRSRKVRGRECWVESPVAMAAPRGFAGVVVRGREASGYCGDVDGLSMDLQGHVLDAGLGPDTAAAAMAMGAAGVVVHEQLFALPELGLGPALSLRARNFADTGTRKVEGFRIAASPLAPVVRRIVAGEDPWTACQGWHGQDDPVKVGWPAGQGLALAGVLADRYGSLEDVVRAYASAMRGFQEKLAHGMHWPDSGPSGRTTAALRASNGRTFVADPTGAVGSGVLWQMAVWEGLPVTGAPLRAAMATGAPVLGPTGEIDAIRQEYTEFFTGSVEFTEPTPFDESILMMEPAPSPVPVAAPAAPTPPAPTPPAAPPVAPAVAAGRPDIAIVGLGSVLPQSPSVAEYWQNVIDGRNCIVDIDRSGRWRPELFFDDNKSAPDKTYARIGGFITGFRFDSRKFRIPPKMAKMIDPVQQMALVAVDQALEDAGITRDSVVDRSRIAVILGQSMGGSVRDQYTMRIQYPAIRHALEQVPGFAALETRAQRQILDAFELEFKEGLPPINEDSMPGELANVTAGRIANAFDLGGPNFTVDAACASSMAAVQAAVKGLQDGDFDVAVTGGADATMDVQTYTKFCKIGALSPDRSSPFDEGANGFVMGEGCGILVLKRLEDAERDGDRVYAVIAGIGASSDGKGKGITAPNIIGQKRALRRAYADAGMDPVEVDLVECHGTSTVVGDKIEVEALAEVIGTGRRGARGPVRIGSVKSQIGHLKSAAGAASLIKASLALHHKVLPPSINFSNPRRDVPFDTVPLQVQTRAENWEAEGWTRVAGVSAFGFGGTNFHVVLKEHLPSAQRPAPAVSRVEVIERPLPEGIWAVSARDHADLARKLDQLDRGQPVPYKPQLPIRVAAAADSLDEQGAQVARIRKVLAKGSKAGFDVLRMRGIHVEDTPCDGKLAFMFTGQGSQYLGMGLDLAERYPLVKQTFDEADEVMVPILGRPLRDLIVGVGKDEAESFNILRATENAQPATLAVDVGILRLLASFGVVPDVVAGHSLGEYGALVAAGVMTFSEAISAVSARGREMANIRLDDPGLMASISAPADLVNEVLVEIPGYVVAANKNSPKQTVIAGASEAVEAAGEAFRSRGITVVPLPVSHAFHTAIVAPASGPLGKVLGRLNIQAPRRPVTTNVTSHWYPDDPEKIVDLLSKQVAAPVEWVAQVERMYGEGARVFVECGPKRALSGMVTTILKRRPHRALSTNHPKVGGLRSFMDGMAGLVAMGFPVKPSTGEVIPDIFAPSEPRLATSEAINAAVGDGSPLQATPFVVDKVMDKVADRAGLSRDALDADLEFEADLGIDTVRQAELVAELRHDFEMPRESGFLLSDHKTIRSVIDYFAGRLGQFEPHWDRSAPAVATQPRPLVPAPVTPAPVAAGAPAVDIGEFLRHAAESGMSGLDAPGFANAMVPAVQALLSATWAAFEASRPPAAPAAVWTGAATQPAAATVRVVCSGAGLGLPGGERVFADDNIESILRGDNRIGVVSPEYRQRFLNKNIVRLVKDASGQGSFLPVSEDEHVIHLAGMAGDFDLVEEYGVSSSWNLALDRVTQLAFAAGIEALRDAGIPLVRTYRETSNGKRVATGWALPESLRDGTGIIFASAFPGYNKLVDLLQNNGADADGNFERRFLFQILAMGHSQFAQFIGARGPNTSVNVACASTTSAIAMASDWMQVGRARRVLVVGADDVTSDSMMEWLGSGFLAAGAATPAARVEDGALPFDKRRHGMIMGMGAVGLMLERDEDVRARGAVPIAELLSSCTVNSAFHGTRLDVEHIGREVSGVVQEACEKEGITATDMAGKAMFMSHETYTPARGGSAAAEINALRQAFGAGANRVVVSNTKGFTGHAMGAGIEDVVAVKALQYGIVPPIPNLREPDEELGDLKLSTGGSHDVQYALRLAAGFGSQLALSVWKAVAKGDLRVSDRPRNDAWIAQVTGIDVPELVVQQGTLRALPAVGRTAAPKAPVKAPVAAAPSQSAADVLSHLMGVISEKTGYGLDELDPTYELEADLGIDTVKQAEIFGEVRDHYGVERDDEFSLADYATIEALAGWLSEASGADAAVAAEPPPVPTLQSEPLASPAPTSAAPASEDAVLAHLLDVISEKTGYDKSELDPEYELEADLGIDTVKQAEIFGEVRDHYGVERDDEFSLADYATIAALAGWLSQAAGAPAAASPSVEDTPQVEDAPEVVVPRPVTAGSAEVMAHLLDVISEKTGYDKDELDPEYELEADLGIDTVKQAEIFGEVRDHYGVERDDEFSLADYSTIAALAAWLSEQIGPDRPASFTELSVDDALDDMVPDSEDPPTSPSAPVVRSAEVLDALLAVISDKTGYEREELELDYELEADLGIDTVKQAEIFGEVRELFGIEQDDAFQLADYPTIGHLAEWLGSRVGVASAVSTSSEPTLDEESIADPLSELPPSFWIRRPVLVPRPLGIEGSLRGRVVRILGDGPVAEALAAQLVAHGAVLGATRADAVVDVACDVMEVFANARDLVGEQPTDWVTLTMMGEMDGMTPDQAFFDGSRAGFTKSLGREWEGCHARVVDVAPELEPARIAELVCHELAAADGTNEIVYGDDGVRHVVELAVHPHPNVGKPRDNQVVIFTGGGRGVTAAVAHEFARRAKGTLVLVGRSAMATEPLDVPAAKAVIKEQLIAEGEKPSPGRIERRLKRLRGADEIRQNVEGMRAEGCIVEYMRCDLADVAAVSALVAEVIERFGRVDGCVHGAGVEESRLIQDKDLEAFHRVFDGKALGGLALAEALPEGAWILSMGSVAGRFGNAGQVDYAAANEAMAQICRSRPGALHVDWTAWGNVGMAVRGGMQRLLEERGVELMPAEAGAALAVDLIAARVEGEVVVAGKLGDFVPSPNHPLLDSMELEGDEVVARYQLDPARDRWIEHHAIDLTPVLPGVMGIELMAGAAVLARPGKQYAGVEDVRFEKPVKCYKGGGVTLEVRAMPVDESRVRCTLSSERTSRAGKLIRTEHFSATIMLGGSPAIEPLPPAFFPDDPIAREQIYRRFFHGPAFQVLRGADAVTRDGLLCTARVEHAFVAQGLLTAPLALEAAFQAAGLHAMVAQGVLALPAAVQVMSILRPVRDGELLNITVMHHPEGDTYDIDVESAQGRVMSVRGYKMVTKGPLPDRDRFVEPEEGWVESAFGTMTVIRAAAGPQASIETGEAMGMASQSEGSAGLLNDFELDELSERGTARRIADRVAGRVAAKRAVVALTGRSPSVVRIENLESGQPVALVDGLPGPRISISHSGGRAVALASNAGPVGIDLEQVVERHTAFEQDWFSRDERGTMHGDPLQLTMAWSAKEAVLKVLGAGMALNPRQIEVQRIQDGRVSLRLSGEVAARVDALGGELEVTVRQTEAGVVSEARVRKVA